MASSLKNGVEREWRNWQKTNPSRRKFSPGSLSTLFLAAGRRPVHAALLLLLAFGVVSVGLHWFPPPYPGLFNFGPRDADKFSVDTLFGALLGTQVAIVAVVYPLVFSFATIFLQRQQATKATLQSYLVRSGAKVTGISSLMLVLGLTVHLALVGAVSPWTAFGWLIAGAVWLALNVGLTAMFLVRTFDFATPEGRRRARNAYAVSIAWPSEWRRNAAHVLAQSPIKHRLMVGDDLMEAVTGKNPAFTSSPVSMQRLDYALKCSFKGRRLVTNVRYGLIELAYRSWRRRALKGSPVAGVKARLYRRDGPMFVLNALPEPEQLAFGDALAGTTGPTALNWFECWLIRRAVSYRSVDFYDHDLTVMDCLEEARADIVSAISNVSTRDFDEQLLALLELFDDLLEASFCIDDNGAVDNQVLTSSRTSYFGGSSLDHWVQVIDDILTSALAVAHADPHFAQSAAATPKRLFRRDRETRNLRVRELFLRRQQHFVYRVLEWGDERLALYRATFHSTMAHDVTSLPEPVASRYQGLLADVLGSWESLKNEAIVPFEEEWLEWGKEVEPLTLLTQHAIGSVALTAHAVRGTEAQGLLRMLDSLLRWRRQLEFVLDDRNDAYIAEPWQLTIQTTLRPWVEVKAALLRGYGDDTALANEAWAVALTNFWRDCCSALAATLGHEARQQDAAQVARAATALRAVLLGQLSNESDGGERERPYEGPQDFLLGLVRQYVLDGSYQSGYRARLDSVVKRVAKDSWRGQVPGRLISLRSADSLEDVRDGQAFCLCVLAEAGWEAVAPELESVFKQWIEANDRRRELDHVLHLLQSALDDQFEGAFTALWQQVLPGNGNFAVTVDRVKTVLGEIRSQLQQVQKEDLVKAEVSDAACQALASEVSAVLALEAAGYPFGPELVEQQDVPVAAALQAHWRITGYPKGRLTLPRLAAKSSNEVELLARHVVARMRSTAVAQVVKQLGPQVKLASTRAQFVRVLDEFKQQLADGETAVLLVPRVTDPTWLGDLRKLSNTRALEESERLSMRGGFGNDRAYVGHYRDTIVYAGLVAPGEMFLVTDAALQGFHLQPVAGGGVLQLSAIADTEEPTLCALSFKWTYETLTRDGPCWKLRYQSARRNRQPARVIKKDSTNGV
ncbi:hypothetical protein [Roseateles depolymerans]|uniref:Uncharacterized protein n=1 Tax=Roseateles depolymerans TaxID=76731 RepID=A0A0U3MJL7_9BURK|nr:hypothetical protein [Roseateles depolymerans]ALV07724.1 hypothetical protein RD2015_3266 [Roseateles depolymerans]REG22052.1 hypothetical protein DES44_1194 [Roseateles depolymerans]